jgi:DNA replication protein DnaC
VSRHLLTSIYDVRGLQEAKTGTIDVADYDSNSVRRLLAYLYIGDYNDGPLNGFGSGAAIIGVAGYGKVHLATAVHELYTHANISRTFCQMNLTVSIFRVAPLKKSCQPALL